MLGAVVLGVPPVAELYQFKVHPEEAVALSVIVLEFLQSEMFVLLTEGAIGKAFTVIFADKLESVPEECFIKNLYSNPLIESGATLIKSNSLSVSA